MTLTRIFLATSGAVWLPYGLFCLARPDALDQTAGIVATSPTGATELRAMYGGLQIALGVLALAGFFRLGRQRVALTTLACLCSGLFAARVLGVFRDGGLSSYTAWALGFESISATAAILLLLKNHRVRAEIPGSGYREWAARSP